MAEGVMEGFIVQNHTFIDVHVLLLLGLYLKEASPLEELSLLNIRQGDVRGFLLPHLVALCHWGYPPYIYVHKNIYIHIYYLDSTIPIASTMPISCRKNANS